MLISVETLRELLDYDELTGALRWKARDARWFKSGGDRQWNGRHAGNRLTCIDKTNGYICFTLFDKPYRAHRAAYAIHHGVWPKNQIDHINGIRDDNRILNLRDVSNQENSKNQKRSSRNTSGVVGVYWCNKEDKWRSQIAVVGRVKTLGAFTNKLDAIAARKQAEIDYGYHENHGRDQDAR